MLTEHDVKYLLMRLGLKADQPAAEAIRQIYGKGVPFGPAARQLQIPIHKMEAIWRQAEAIRAGFTVTNAETFGLSYNDVLAYQRRREVEAFTAETRRDALKAAGFTDEQIKGLI